MAWISLKRLGVALELIKEKVVLKEAGKGLFSGLYEDLTGKPTIPIYTSDLKNDSDFQTGKQVDQKISSLNHLTYTVVDKLPPAEYANENTIYLEPKRGSGGDTFDEWLLVKGNFEYIGNMGNVNLTDYLRIENEATDKDIQNLFAGWQ